MAVRGTFRQKPIRADEQFAVVSDQRLRMSLVALANKYSEDIRNLIYRCYTDDRLAAEYRAQRAASHLTPSTAMRKVIEFPNGYVFDFCDTVMTSLYGPDWLDDRRKFRKALRHELLRPWWVVSKP